MRRWLATPRSDTSMWFSQATTAIPLFIWDTPLLPLPTVCTSYVLEAPGGLLFFCGAINHLRQGVRYHAKGCVALGWKLAGIIIDLTGHWAWAPFHSCLMGNCGLSFFRSPLPVGPYMDTNGGKTGFKHSKRKRDSQIPTTRNCLAGGWMLMYTISGY